MATKKKPMYGDKLGETRARYVDSQGYDSDVPGPGKNTYTGQERTGKENAGRGNVHPPMSKKWIEK